MPQNIENISLWTDNPQGRGLPLVRIDFKFPCEWTILNINDLKKILELWIIGEEIKYPQSKGFKGREMLFNEIKKVFDETEVN